MFLFPDSSNRELEMKHDGGKSERTNIFPPVFTDMVSLSFIFLFVDSLGCFYCIFVLFSLFPFSGGLTRKLSRYPVALLKAT